MKIIIIFITLGVATLAAAGYSHGGDYGYHGYGHEDYHTHPKYQFDYGVKDAHTGDHKSQWEHRDGDKVKGGYTLDEADGTKRVVEYHADHHNGFQAVVKRVGHAHHPQHYQTHHYGGHGSYNGGHGGYDQQGYGHGYGYGGHGHASSYANHVQSHHNHY